MNRKTQGCLHGSNTTAMTPYYTYKTQEKKVFISLKLWPWQPSLRNRQEWSISLSWAALDHQMWLARDCYNILFFLWTKYYKLCLLVLVLPTQFSGFCSYWMMHFYRRGHACFPASRWGIHCHHMTCHIIRLQCFLFAVTAKVSKILNIAVLLWPSNSDDSYSITVLCEWGIISELILFKNSMWSRTNPFLYK